MEAKSMRCPECGSEVLPSELRSPSFNCQKCKSEVCVPRSYWVKVRVSTIPVTFLLCYLAGLRGVLLVVIFAVASPVLGMFVTAAATRFFPPVIDRYCPPGTLGLYQK